MELKHYDWSREPTEKADHEVIFLQSPGPERTWCSDDIDEDLQTDTAYVRADKLREAYEMLSRCHDSCAFGVDDDVRKLLREAGWAP